MEHTCLCPLGTEGAKLWGNGIKNKEPGIRMENEKKVVGCMVEKALKTKEAMGDMRQEILDVRHYPLTIIHYQFTINNSMSFS